MKAQLRNLSQAQRTWLMATGSGHNDGRVALSSVQRIIVSNGASLLGQVKPRRTPNRATSLKPSCEFTSGAMFVSISISLQSNDPAALACSLTMSSVHEII